MVEARFVVAALLAASGYAVAADQPVASVSSANAMAIARSNACMGCHAVDRKLVGPSFQQVAQKYKGDAQASAKLAKKVKDGGAGVWGSIPMPSHPAMNDGDIKTVVAWVLAGAPQK
ncbi:MULTISPECIES: c-type cytochrome [unclassified Caballeronia]|uniref:c-type cytochrome n=1 Tax=unclassified Caballeronia TaxID=2646786 RepID=UPI00158E9A2C|nr:MULTISPECIES: c-type cytochrome [unclassified Caballeronia]QSN61329.1 c-type cytochrome [Caballeronia sp. M1242]